MGPEKAVDGDEGVHSGIGESCAHTAGPENDPWWAIDLGEAMYIAKVEVLNRGDCCGDRLHDFDAGVMDTDPTNMTTAVGQYSLCAHYSGGAPAGSWSTLQCKFAAKGRYLVIVIPGINQVLTLCEVRVYAAAVIYLETADNYLDADNVTTLTDMDNTTCLTIPSTWGTGQYLKGRVSLPETQRVQLTTVIEITGTNLEQDDYSKKISFSITVSGGGRVPCPDRNCTDSGGIETCLFVCTCTITPCSEVNIFMSDFRYAEKTRIQLCELNLE